MIKPKLEAEYLVWDILPLALVAAVGLIVLLVSCCGCCACCRNCSKSFGLLIIPWLYGGDVHESPVIRQPAQDEVRTQTRPQKDVDYRLNIDGEEIDPNRFKCLHKMMLAAAIALGIQVFLIFTDTFFVKSEYGCREDRNCYVVDHNHMKYPLQNCSDYLDTLPLEKKTICYWYNLDFFEAVVAMGGVSVVAAVATIILTKLLIKFTKKCHRNSKRSRDDPKWCCAGMLAGQITAMLIMLAVVATVVVCIHLYVLRFTENITYLRAVGHSLHYTAVILTLCITLTTPWVQLQTGGNYGRLE